MDSVYKLFLRCSIFISNIYHFDFFFLSVQLPVKSDTVANSVTFCLVPQSVLTGLRC